MTAKVLTVGLLNPIEDLDPERPVQEALQLIRQFLEPPFEYAPGSGEIRPVLFEGPLADVSGGAAAAFKGRLKSDLRFSDGTPATAAHLAETLRAASVLKDRADVSTDGDSVVFRLRQPNRRFDVTLTHVECFLRRRAGRQLLGTGAFVLAPGGTPRERRLVRNRHFRREVPLQEIRFKVYPPTGDGDPVALVEALQRGEADLTTVLPRDAAGQLSGVRKLVLPGFSTAMVFFNVESPRLADPRLRRSLAHCINRDEFAADAYENPIAFTASSLLPKSMATAQDGLHYDPVLGRSILAEAGLKPPPRLKVLLIWGSRPYLPSPARAAEMLARQLSTLGIALDMVRTSTIQEYYDRMIEGTQDLTLAGWTADTLDPSDFLESCLASHRVPTRANAAVSVNNARLRSPAMDRAVAAYRTEPTPERLDAIMGVVHDEAPLVPLMYGSTCTISSFRVAGLKASPLTWMDLAELDVSS